MTQASEGTGGTAADRAAAGGAAAGSATTAGPGAPLGREAVLERITRSRRRAARAGREGVWDDEAQLREVRELAGVLGTVGQQEEPHTILTEAEVVTALAEVIRQATRLGEPQVALSLTGAVEAVAAALGAEHADTLTLRFTLAGAYRQTEPAMAITLYEQVVEGAVQLLGADHPQVLTARSGLAGALTDAGRTEQAVALYEQMAQDAARLLGPAHPDALSARNNLARAWEAAGQEPRALEIYEDLVHDAERALHGPHPYLMVFRRNLERLRSGIEEPGAAAH